MTNLTKQEIQEYRGVISTLIDVRQGDKMLEKVLSVALKALDIAEKQVWRPISEAPKDPQNFLVYVPDCGIYWVVGKSETSLWITDGTEPPWLADMDYMPTHYMPLPTPPAIKTRPADVETLPIDAFDFNPEEGTVILETSTKK